MARPGVLLAWSGGKDAAWALHVLRNQADVDVVGLLTTLTEGHERISMQGIRRDVLHAQARAAGLPVIEAWIPQDCDNTRYIASFSTALAQAQARWPGLSQIAFGDLFLPDVRAWRESVCAALGWTPRFPLFGSDTAQLARRMLADGLEALLCCVDTTQLDATFAGHPFDAALLSTLPAHCDPCGERGEFHTCVVAGPMFHTRLHVQRGQTVLRDGRFVYTDVLLTGDSAPVQ